MLPVFASNPASALVLAITSFLWIAPEMVRSRVRRPSHGTTTQDRLSGAAVMICIWSAVVLGMLAAFRVPQPAMRLPRQPLFDAGIVLMLAGVAFRWYAIRVLGPFFSVLVNVQPGQTVVEAGPYHWLRHPSYSGAMLTLFGLGLVFGNWLSLLLIMLLAALGYGYRIAVEEKALQQALGEPYRQYMKRTKRIIPFVI